MVVVVVVVVVAVAVQRAAGGGQRVAGSSQPSAVVLLEVEVIISRSSIVSATGNKSRRLRHANPNLSHKIYKKLKDLWLQHSQWSLRCRSGSTWTRLQFAEHPFEWVNILLVLFKYKQLIFKVLVAFGAWLRLSDLVRSIAATAEPQRSSHCWTAADSAAKNGKFGYKNAGSVP